VIEHYHNPTDFQKFTVWLRVVPSVQGLRMRLDHFDEVRQFDRLRTAVRAGVPRGRKHSKLWANRRKIASGQAGWVRWFSARHSHQRQSHYPSIWLRQTFV